MPVHPPEIVELAARDRAPHRVATWIRELAAAFHGFYHDCPVLRSDVATELQQARLWLVESARIGFAIGLDLLGITARRNVKGPHESHRNR